MFQTESDGRTGLSSGLLDSSADAESKRAKLLYGSRGLYSRTPGASAAGSSYCRVRGTKPPEQNLQTRFLQSPG